MHYIPCNGWITARGMKLRRWQCKSYRWRSTVDLIILCYEQRSDGKMGHDGRGPIQTDRRGGTYLARTALYAFDVSWVANSSCKLSLSTLSWFSILLS